MSWGTAHIWAGDLVFSAMDGKDGGTAHLWAGDLVFRAMDGKDGEVQSAASMRNLRESLQKGDPCCDPHVADNRVGVIHGLLSLHEKNGFELTLLGGGMLSAAGNPGWYQLR